MGMEFPDNRRLADDSYPRSLRGRSLSFYMRGAGMIAIWGYLIVFFGAGIGGALRHAINRATLPSGSLFPVGTFFINVSGSLAMGVIAGWLTFRADGAGHFASGFHGQHVRLFLTTGLLGGFTTFSAFSLDTALLIERGRFGFAVLYATGSVLVSVAALFTGLAIMRY